MTENIPIFITMSVSVSKSQEAEEPNDPAVVTAPAEDVHTDADLGLGVLGRLDRDRPGVGGGVGVGGLGGLVREGRRRTENTKLTIL